MSSAIILDPSVEKSLNRGLFLASHNSHEFFTLDHWALGILELKETQEMFTTMHISLNDMKRKIHENIKKTVGDLNSLEDTETAQAMNDKGHGLKNSMEKESLSDMSPSWTLSIKRVLFQASKIANLHNINTVSLGLVWLSLLNEEDSRVVYYFKKAGLSKLKIKQYLEGRRNFHSVNHNVDLSKEEGLPGYLGVTDSEEDETSEKTSYLSAFGKNLNELAKKNKIDPLIGRKLEVQRTAQILGRRRKNNPLLVGEPGVGKTAIAEGLAKLIINKEAPNTLHDKTIWSINMGALLAGTKYRGDFEQRVKGIVEEAKKDPNVILFIDEIHTMIGAGSSGGNAMDASNIIKPALSSGEIHLIGSTTFQEYREIFEKEKALNRRFQKVDINEPTPEETVSILKGLKKGLESHHEVKYTKQAIKSAVELSVKYLPDRCLPDKAIDVLDEAGSAEKMKIDSVRKKFIDEATIIEVVANITKLPISKITHTEKDNLSSLSNDLKNIIFGQDKAIDALTDSVCISKAGLNNEDKPMGSFLFAGPTGVGKTEITKQLSRKMGIPLIRFDMSEYTESHSVARLIGSPPGYVGHEKGGLLTDSVFKTPHCILLLDEIEKAHPDIYNVLLQMLDYGTLTDANGRKVNFKNTFIVMTTNSGINESMKPSIGFIQTDHKSEGQKVLNMTFPPEFRNRLDNIIYFNALGHKEIIQIVDKNIQLLQTKLNNKKIELSVSQGVKNLLAQEGYTPDMGARPMERVINEKLKKPLSRQILFGDLSKGGKVSVSLNDDKSFEWKTEKLKKASTMSKKKSQSSTINTRKNTNKVKM